MRIAQVAPLFESVPPAMYGGTERVVHYLTEELVRMGHDVTLFATGDSRTSARLVASRDRAIRLDEECKDKMANHIIMIEQVASMADEFDVIHFHIDYIHFPVMRRLGKPYLTTLHGRQDHPELAQLFHHFSDAPVVSISDAQRAPLPMANWQGTVHHGIPANVFQFNPKPEGYLAFIGRLSREKGVDRAIQIAKLVNQRLKIAAKVDEADVTYYEEVLEPMMRHPLVEYIGEITEDEKSDFLGNAKALLFPINWPEPFGLVMIEAMACGTPVVAFRQGSVPEIITAGRTGVIVNTVAEAAAEVRRIDRINRLGCRQEFEKKFTAARMAADYVQIYERLCEYEWEAPVYGKSIPA